MHGWRYRHDDLRDVKPIDADDEFEGRSVEDGAGRFIGSSYLPFISKIWKRIVAWAALVPLFFALQGVQSREGFKLGFLAGFAAHVGILYWIVYVVVQYGYLPFYVGIAAMLLLSAY